MTLRNLDSLFKPASVALIGASRKPHSIGAVVARNLFHSGLSGVEFAGPIMPVNPHERAIEGVMTYHSVAELPLAPELAILCTPAATVPGLLAELGARGTRAAVILSAGFDDALRQQALAAAQPYLMRLVGPYSLGVMVPGRGLNASLSQQAPLKGDIAFVAQSGAVVTSVVDWATARGIGFSHLVALGDKADVDFGDLLDYLAADPGVRAILLYVEAINDARKFMSAARTAARQKPVIAIKAGRSEAAAPAVRSHTGALVAADAVYEAAFARAGILRVQELDELFDAVETLAMGIPIQGERLAILTNGGGIGVMATDTLVDAGGRLAEFSPEALAKVQGLLPQRAAAGNPLYIGFDAGPERYAAALTAMLEDRSHDAVLVLHCPSPLAEATTAAQAVVDVMTRHNVPGRRHPVLTSWLGDGASAGAARRLFAGRHMPTYETPGHAVRAFLHLVAYRRNQELLMETPPSVPEQFTADVAAARAQVERVLAERVPVEGRAWLSEYEAKEVLKAYGVPVVDTRRVATPEAAATAAAAIGGPVALKVLSQDILHKSDVGGVALHLLTPEAVRREAEAMRARVAVLAPQARLEGFTVQAMAPRTDAHELFLGMTDDPVFGPVLAFGQGGTGVEVVADQALALPPLNMKLARELMARTRIWRVLQGYRSRPAAALDAIALTLIKVSQLIIDIPEICELDINPLFADDTGVLALDARIGVATPRYPGASRLAIRPYPKELEETGCLRDGRCFRLRPIRPEDEPLVHDLFASMTANDIRLRFFAPMKRLSHQAAARLTQIDYDREMGLVAVTNHPENSAGEIMYGVVRIAADPDNQKAEYAVMVRSDMKGQGLGILLMNKIIDYARQKGLKTVYGEVLRENTNMLAVCRRLGFVRRESMDEPGVVEVSIDLAQAP